MNAGHSATGGALSSSLSDNRLPTISRRMDSIGNYAYGVYRSNSKNKPLYSSAPNTIAGPNKWENDEIVWNSAISGFKRIRIVPILVDAKN